MGTATDVHYGKPIKRRVKKTKKAAAQQARNNEALLKHIGAMRIEIAELKSTINAQAEQISHWARKFETLAFSLEALTGHQQRHEDALIRLMNSNEIIVHDADGPKRVIFRDGSVADVVIS